MSCPIRDVLYVFTCFYVTLQKTKVKQSLSIYCEFQHEIGELHVAFRMTWLVLSTKRWSPLVL